MALPTPVQRELEQKQEKGNRIVPVAALEKNSRDSSAQPLPAAARTLPIVTPAPLASPPVSTASGTSSNNAFLRSPSVSGSSAPTPSATGPGGSGANPVAPTQPPPGLLLITGVFVDGQNITGVSAPGAVQANYSGKEIRFKINGYFPEDATLETTEIFLNNEIFLTPDSVGRNEIQAHMNTRHIPDLYLVGNSHTLSVAFLEQTLKVQIRVGPPEQGADLSPVISNAELQMNEEGQPEYLAVDGLHLMLNPFFAQAQIDNKPVEILQSGVEDGEFWMDLALPEDEEIFANTSHTLKYQTPFGVVFYNF